MSTHDTSEKCNIPNVAELLPHATANIEKGLETSTRSIDLKKTSKKASNDVVDILQENYSITDIHKSGKQEAKERTYIPDSKTKGQQLTSNVPVNSNHEEQANSTSIKSISGNKHPIKTVVMSNVNDVKERTSSEVSMLNEERQSSKETSTADKKVQFNPYAKLKLHVQSEHNTITEGKESIEEQEYPNKLTVHNNSNVNSTDSISQPAKRTTSELNIMNTPPKKKSATSVNRQPVSLLVEGYAFYDDVIGVAHRRSDGREAFNLVLRNMVFNKELEEDGFSAYVALRDKSSGKEDNLLTSEDGYPRFLFLSINVHHFVSAHDANTAVLKQCQKLQTVRLTICSKNILFLNS